MTASCAQDANAAERGLPDGQPLQQSERPTSFPAGLLVVRYPQPLSFDQAERINVMLEPFAESLNLKALLLERGADAHIQTDNTALIAAIHAQVDAINRLADSNEGLIQAMAEADGDEPAQPRRYMDGSPAR